MMLDFKKGGFLNALGIAVYVTIVSLIMNNGDKLFGQKESPVAPVAFLLLFSLSALVVGSLVLGKPILFYLDGKKKEAISLFVNTSIWLAIFTVLAIVIAAVL